MISGSAWPEKAELADTVRQMLKTVPVAMFALARDAEEEICIFDGSGVRYTIQPPRYECGRQHYAVIEWGNGRLSNCTQTHLVPSRWELLTWIMQHLLMPVNRNLDNPTE
jgi:hypothetical protein